MTLRNLRIGVRMGMAFMLLCVFLAAVAATGIYSAQRIGASVDDIVGDKWPKTVLANDIIDGINANALQLSYVLMLEGAAGAEAEVKRRREAIDALAKKNTESFDKLAKLVNTDKGRAALKTVHEKRAEFQGARRKVLDEVKKDRNAAFLMASTAMAPVQEQYIKAVGDLVTVFGDQVEVAGKDARETYGLGLKLIAALGASALFLAALVGWLVTRSITGPIRQAVGIAGTVASGDLSSRIEVKSRDETGQLLAALRDMSESLKKVVGQVRGASDSIGTASGQIASGNQDLSSRTEEQASSLEETASSMEELTSTVKQNAENARQANQLAAGASSVAAKGGEVVGEVVTTMNAISESSKKIADIISVIDSIAFQTNILALNAAVEAARAGEQGRGFAVVASEVRSLAQKSAGAAKEIKTLIEDSVAKVESGSRQADAAGRTMEEVVAAVKRVTDIMAEISAASAEQSTGIEQVNQAITQMDQVTQQNAALVEESAAAAESMKEQAQSLIATVSVFKLSDHNDKGAASPVVVATPVSKVPAMSRVEAKPAANKPVSPKPKLVNARADEKDWEEF